jgi:hypothetical protein
MGNLYIGSEKVFHGHQEVSPYFVLDPLRWTMRVPGTHEMYILMIFSRSTNVLRFQNFACSLLNRILNKIKVSFIMLELWKPFSL